jgi:hypothetical protein
MDRRRFIPNPEGLEGRALLASSVNLGNLFGFQVNTNLNIPITYEQKTLRIERLPYYLEKIRPGRFLPQPELNQIQVALNGLMDGIHKPPSSALDNYNYQLRHVVPKQSLTPVDAGILNNGFTAVLHAAGTVPTSVVGLKTALFQMTTKFDTASPEPVYLATNDYTLVLQTALAVGRPMPPPILPKIAKNQGIQADASHIKTPLKHPSLVGTYHFHTTIQVITPDGVVVGEAKCRRTNQYKVTITPALSPGLYQFRMRAVDTVGHLSKVSRPFEMKVVPLRHHNKLKAITGVATPEGPLGAKT